ncbi:MAG TPA: hypothetical protein VF997_18395 [Polyangia bacterium]
MDKEKVREPYEPPIVEDVPLRAEEQVLAGCKGPRHNGPGPISFQCRQLGRGCMNITTS